MGRFIFFLFRFFLYVSIGFLKTHKRGFCQVMILGGLIQYEVEIVSSHPRKRKRGSRVGKVTTEATYLASKRKNEENRDANLYRSTLNPLSFDMGCLVLARLVRWTQHTRTKDRDHEDFLPANSSLRSLQKKRGAPTPAQQLNASNYLRLHFAWPQTCFLCLAVLKFWSL